MSHKVPATNAELMSRDVEPLPTTPAVKFQDAARLALGDHQLRHNMGVATQAIRAKRAKVVQELPDWELLRAAGRAIKDRTLRHLESYLLQLEAAVTRAGGRVHWARDAAEANRIIAGIVTGHGAKEVVKIKSLTTDEIGLNEALGRAGVEAIETDLAELIIQLAGERSSLCRSIARIALSTPPRSRNASAFSLSGCASTRPVFERSGPRNCHRPSLTPVRRGACGGWSCRPTCRKDGRLRV